jgi:hypothetical protein
MQLFRFFAFDDSETAFTSAGLKRDISQEETPSVHKFRFDFESCPTAIAGNSIREAMKTRGRLIRRF